MELGTHAHGSRTGRLICRGNNRAVTFTDEDMTMIRTFAGGLVEFAEAFRSLWAAQLAAKTREVDKALEGLAASAPKP